MALALWWLTVASRCAGHPPRSRPSERTKCAMSLPYRQGDLLFVGQETRPTEPLAERPGRVIAAGEATGHAHRLTVGTILEAPDNTLYLDLSVAARVVHEEHDALTLGPGLWRVVRQREYTPEAMRTVRD